MDFYLTCEMNFVVNSDRFIKKINNKQFYFVNPFFLRTYSEKNIN